MDDLKALRATIISGVVSDSDKKTIRKEYEAVFQTKLVNERGCQNCWVDALDKIILKLSSGEMTMCAGSMIEHEGVLYHRLNITDPIAQKIIETQPDNEIYFYKK